MFKKLFYTSILFGFILSAAKSQKVLEKIDYVSKVNTLIGSNNNFLLSHGNTLPLVTRPFGMTTWCAQTAEGGNWMYNYNDTVIHAFRATHQPSPWMGDYATFNLMPSNGHPERNLSRRSSKYSHRNEKAFPHYYEVDLLSNKIKVGMTATERCGYLEFTFPKSTNSLVYLDVVKGGAELKIFPKLNKVTGIARNNSGGAPSNFAGYFVILFDKQFQDFGIFNKSGFASKVLSVVGDSAQGALVFQTREGEKIHAKIGTSFISSEQAEKNLLDEIGDKSFDQIKKEGFDHWNKEFSKLAVEGGTASQETTFYSAYYRSLIFPSKFYELDKLNKKIYYSPYDGKIHSGVMYTNNGLWDTYRAALPLLTILKPEVHAELCQSLVNAYKEGGWLPRWLSPGYREIMIGVHAASIFADAYTKGIRDFDYNTAYEAMIKDASQENPISGRNKEGLSHYNEKGYVLGTVRESVAKNLEYAYDDYCVSLMAKALNKSDLLTLEKRALNYKNSFDGSTNFMRGRDVKNRWRSPFNPFSWGGDYTEGNAWHYLWSVFHDPAGLIDLFGGEKNFVSKMDSVFTSPTTSEFSYYGYKIHEITEMENANMGQYAQGNQPIQHFIYLYNYAKQPWKAQYWARKIMTTLYGTDQNGLCGDEDNGQTSAWYVMSALGFYSVCPGNAQYVFGSPLFPKATITLPNGNVMVISAEGNNKDNVYIQNASLNGEMYDKTFITHAELVKGGSLRFKMGNSPNRSWGTSNSSTPLSFTKRSFCSPPYSNIPTGRYDQKLNVVLSSRTENSYITYTLDGTDPARTSLRYSSPIVVAHNAIINARTFHETKDSSERVTLNFNYDMKEPLPAADLKSGIRYNYYEGTGEVLPDFTKIKPVKSGVLKIFEISPRAQEDMFAFSYEGFIKVPETAIYTIYSKTDDGCRIIIDGEVIHEANGRHGMELYNEKVGLKAGYHAIKLEYNEIDLGEGIEIQIEGGGIKKQVIGEGLLFYK
ncbi:MAG TPA: GH92 family glycosyl hydrolase [Cytophagaceae bacterium]|jgi:predicted alpha-1,2-mannosidase